MGSAAAGRPRFESKAGIPTLTVGYHSKTRLPLPSQSPTSSQFPPKRCPGPTNCSAAAGATMHPRRPHRYGRPSAVEDQAQGRDARAAGPGRAPGRLDDGKLDSLAADALLPEQLVEAVRQARKISAWGARKRQLQFIGKLMRDVDPVPIESRLARLDAGHSRRYRAPARARAMAGAAAGRARRARRTRGRLPGPRRPRLRPLIARAREERIHGSPPHAYRELFRALKALDGES